VIDPGTLKVEGATIPYVVASGYGIGEFIDNFRGTAEVDLAWAGFSTRSTPLRRAQDIIRRIADAFGFAPRPVRIEAHGDSITFGSNAADPATQSYPAILQGALVTAGFTGMIVNNHGNPGWTTDMLVDAGELATQIDGHFSRRYRHHFYIGMAGTNDIKPVNHASAEHVIDNLTTMFSGRRAAGFRTFGMTLFPYDASLSPDATVDGKRRAINTWVRTTALDQGLVEGVIDLESEVNAALYGDMNLHAFHSDDTHPNEAGYEAMGLMARDFFLPLMA